MTSVKDSLVTFVFLFVCRDQCSEASRMNQRNTPKPDSLIDLEEWVADPSAEDNLDNVIYKRDSLKPDKRRRIEALLEEKRLMREITDVFEDDEWEH